MPTRAIYVGAIGMIVIVMVRIITMPIPDMRRTGIRRTVLSPARRTMTDGGAAITGRTSTTGRAAIARGTSCTWGTTVIRRSCITWGLCPGPSRLKRSPRLGRTRRLWRLRDGSVRLYGGALRRRCGLWRRTRLYGGALRRRRRSRLRHRTLWLWRWTRLHRGTLWSRCRPWRRTRRWLAFLSQGDQAQTSCQ
jgi:hypothetical protein